MGIIKSVIAPEAFPVIVAIVESFADKNRAAQSVADHRKRAAGLNGNHSAKHTRHLRKAVRVAMTVIACRLFTKNFPRITGSVS